MKTNSKIYLLASLFLMVMFTACNEDVVRDPSPAANPNSSNVYFSALNDSNLVLGLEETSFKFAVIREKKDAALNVKLSTENVYGEIFTIPSTVSFAAGQDSVEIEVVVKNMELMKKYKISVSIDQSETNPYVIQSVYPRLDLSVLKEDFAPYAEGTYVSEFFEDEWPMTLEYSPATKNYRFKDCWEVGYDVLFKWDEVAAPGDVNIVGALTSAKDFVFLKTGVVDDKYGMISAYYDAVKIKYYDSVTKTFTFPITWRVSAGSFGLYPDTYEITTVL